MIRPLIIHTGGKYDTPTPSQLRQLDSFPYLITGLHHKSTRLHIFHCCIRSNFPPCSINNNIKINHWLKRNITYPTIITFITTTQKKKRKSKRTCMEMSSTTLGKYCTRERIIVICFLNGSSTINHIYINKIILETECFGAV